MRAFRQLLKVAALRSLREPVSVVFTLAFAPAFVVVMGIIFGNDPTPQFGGRGFLETNVAAFPGIAIAITSVIMVPVDMVGQRSAGVLRRFRATPLSPAAYLAADIIVRLVLAFASIVAMYAVVILVFGVRPTSVLALVSTLVSTLLGLAAFLALGYLLAARVRVVGAAQGIGNMLLYPLIFTSGAAVPMAVLPEGVRAVARFSPLTQLTYLGQGLWNGESWAAHWGSAVVLLVFGLACGLLAARLFRWE